MGGPSPVRPRPRIRLVVPDSPHGRLPPTPISPGPSQGTYARSIRLGSAAAVKLSNVYAPSTRLGPTLSRRSNCHPGRTHEHLPAQNDDGTDPSPARGPAPFGTPTLAGSGRAGRSLSVNNTTRSAGPDRPRSTRFAADPLLSSHSMCDHRWGWAPSVPVHAELVEALDRPRTLRRPIRSSCGRLVG